MSFVPGQAKGRQLKPRSERRLQHTPVTPALPQRAEKVAWIMSEPITMPTLSDTMNTGRLVKWVMKLGDPIKKGDTISEIETDKAVMEVTAFHDGYLAGPLALEGAEMPVGQIIGYIADSPGGTAAAKAAPVAPKVASPETAHAADAPAEVGKDPNAAAPAAVKGAPAPVAKPAVAPVQKTSAQNP